MRYDPPLHKTQGLLPLILAAVALLVYPLVFEATYFRHVMILAFIFAIVATNWDLSLGYAGLFNFGHVALFAVGIYTYAILAKTLGVSPWLAILAGGGTAAIVALLIALPVLRLDGIYVILVTIALSQLIYLVVISWSDVTGGTSGMVTLPTLKIGDYRLSKDGRIGYYYIGLGLLALNIAFLYLLTRSRLGRAIMALRDNKYYAIARGVSEARTRALTLTASAVFTGIAGAFYGAYLRVASPDAFGMGFLTLVLSMLLVGGTGTIWGPLIGAFAISFLSEWLAGFGPWQNIIVALAIILVVVFYPGGLWAALQQLREVADGLRSQTLARIGRRRGKSAREALTGARERMLKTRYGQIAVADTGPTTGAGKPALLFLHGNSACKEAFYKQFRSFADRYRVIAFDLPGHGVSDNADPETTYNVDAYTRIAEEVLADCGVTRVHVFGWSLGGYVALELAARGTVEVTSLAICGTPPLAVVPDDMGRAYVPTAHMVLTAKQYFSREEARSYGQHATAPLSEESAFLHRAVRRTDGRARAYMMTKLSITDWPRQMRMLAEGRIPTAILDGSDDPFLNHDYVAGLKYGNLWKGAPQDIQDGKHAPFFNRTDAFDLTYFSFLRFAENDHMAGDAPA
ncbi:alpha/beta fold hydrolase [Pseudodonghicola flavimaris]|uniref:Alpha/beta fold hydrolase n=1 Tax=Pseudodonghicola flavimaris TaxID=3050036 RepID=A0ABT7F5A7_9RHOB|nr:alpha/beta fold hydrolase [Pseudodonghicola flavimaris]MDK3019794.1 alpha/beta fold hydrolase [Pseudodonghicola flavimaris]